MRELMDGIVRFLPPADTRENTPLSGVVFAIEHDPVMGKAAHVRLFGGQLRNRDAVPVLGRSEMEKITQIRRISGSRATDAGVLRGGEIGALYGLPSIRAGDILGAQERRRPGPPGGAPAAGAGVSLLRGGAVPSAGRPAGA